MCTVSLVMWHALKDSNFVVLLQPLPLLTPGPTQNFHVHITILCWCMLCIVLCLHTTCTVLSPVQSSTLGSKQWVHEIKCCLLPSIVHWIVCQLWGLANQYVWRVVGPYLEGRLLVLQQPGGREGANLSMSFPLSISLSLSYCTIYMYSQSV